MSRLPHALARLLRTLRWPAFALLPLLFLPLRAAEPPPATPPASPPRSEQPSAAQPDDAPVTAPAGARPPATSTSPAPASSSESADDDEDADEQPLERVSADNNLSFPVDI